MRYWLVKAAREIEARNIAPGLENHFGPFQDYQSAQECVLKLVTVDWGRAIISEVPDPFKSSKGEGK